MSIFSCNNEIYFWDRKEFEIKNGISLLELFLFFKLKGFSDLKDVSPSYEKFLDWDRKIKNISYSFSQFPIKPCDDDPWRMIPKRILEGYNEFKEETLIEGLKWCESQISKEDFVKINLFFKDIFAGNVIKKMDYALKSNNGLGKVSLSFAENFRFKSNSNSFNLFSLKKEDREIVIPQDDNSCIFAADFRQFEFRTFLEIQGMTEYFNDNLYENLGKDLNIKTQDLKVGIIAYLYGNGNENLEKFFRRNVILQQIKNNVFWYKEMPVYVPEEHTDGKKIHTIVQTLSQYRYLEKLEKILIKLENYNSKFIFPLHDSIIISLRKDEIDLIDDLVNILEDGTYKVKCFIGPNYKDLTEI